MSSFNNTDQLLYVAGVGLLLNIFLFATTLLIYLCKPHTQNTDLEAFDNHLHYNDDDLNVSLLQQRDDHTDNKYTKVISSRLIDLIPAMKFLQLPKDDHRDSIRRNGCSICLREGYEDDDMCKILPECDHVFHSECIDQWLNKKQSCPVCRKIFRVVLPTV
ncbi:hypothetical protein BVRB_4g087040 [Beta vulgaris subsp. vulgaris]|uniref:RING-type domain-containing protein n=1 Tax=Beta vulgaris subsp. vulgaris TaxID=3555 RepID=A0A0J8CH82_BETVV|nr:hypothetical protein BVRB_4g087040 [Beta vulgaris subsp. vulgaris]